MVPGRAGHVAARARTAANSARQRSVDGHRQRGGVGADGRRCAFSLKQPAPALEVPGDDPEVCSRPPVAGGDGRLLRSVDAVAAARATSRHHRHRTQLKGWTIHHQGEEADPSHPPRLGHAQERADRPNRVRERAPTLPEEGNQHVRAARVTDLRDLARNKTSTKRKMSDKNLDLQSSGLIHLTPGC